VNDPLLTRWRVEHGDCRDLLRALPDQSIDSIVTDPPYELGFMGKAWDSTGIAYQVDVWRECLRVLKHGGYLLAFGGSRTYHRLACAIEDAGFEIRDQIMWVYGSGFPKSLDVSKAIDKQAGAEPVLVSETPQRVGFDPAAQGGGGFQRGTIQVTVPATDAAKEWQGWGTALKPAHEPIVLARKPLDGTVAQNVIWYGTGALNIDGCRVGTEKVVTRGGRSVPITGDQREGAALGMYGTHDPLNTEHQGRFPANLIHDGSDEVLELFPDSKSQKSLRGDEQGGLYRGGWSGNTVRGHDDSGSAARFFYCAKASKTDRNEGLDDFAPKRDADRVRDDGVGGANPRNRTNTAKVNHHPTVKPTMLMRYLVRLVTRPDGVVLDPFCGSGSTGKAAIYEHLRFIGFEQSADYVAIAQARINYAEQHREG